jgi:O-antigen/teichoic acid export membrane protein
VGYIFLANLMASSIMLIMLLPEMYKTKPVFSKTLWRAMLVFGVPLMISGLAGVANEMLDRQLLKYLLPEDTWQAQVGIYGAVYKLSIFLVLFNQAFRYAAEPFFFSTERQTQAKETFATVMTYFVMVMAIGYVFVMAYLDLIKYFIDQKFWEGLHIVPILLIANVFLGINTNLSFWYKLSDKTNWAIVITGFGLLLTVGFNIWLIPKMGYVGAAWATLISYAGMMVLSFFMGQHFYPIPYKTGKILLVLILAFALGGFAYHFAKHTFVPQTAFFLLFIGILSFIERKSLAKFTQRIRGRNA